MSATATPVAALPMYDPPGVRRANDALWSRLATALAARGFSVPDCLERGRPPGEIWRDSGLLFAQTCGYPYVTELTGFVRIVATPCYDVIGCKGGYYSSHIVVRRDEPVTALEQMRGRAVAINGMNSQSGFAALQAACANFFAPFFRRSFLSGSHIGSMRAVAAGEADVAAIDAVSWALARRDCPQIAGRLKSIAMTALTPGLPFVTANSRTDREVACMREALVECLADPASQAARKALFMTGIEIVDEAKYCAAYRLVDDDVAAALIPPVATGAHRADRSRVAHDRLG